jgi:curved DNA-binding protein CbpA
VTDYFAFFHQPRRPWIDLEKLEEKYRELARSTHPDQSAQPSNDFAQVNEGYRLLRDPKSRLQHLLELEGKLPRDSAEVPAALADLFMRIAPILRGDDTNEMTILVEELNELHQEAINRLRQLDKVWTNKAETNEREAKNLYRRFSFLTRWKNLLEEHRFNASN